MNDLPDHSLEGSSRYVRQIILPGIGELGQSKLKEAHVLIAGVGGLGSLSSLYLCAAGIGRLTVVDSGRVQLSDLNRQILYGEKDLGRRKVEAAVRRLSEMNSEITVNPIFGEMTEDSVSDLLENVQIVVDGTDNFRTRFLLNAACHTRGIPYVCGGVFGLKGTAMTIIPGQTPCLKCFHPEKKMPASPIPAISAVVGVIASVQVLEVLKLILSLGEGLAGRLLVFEGSTTSFRTLAIRKRKDCEVCSVSSIGGALK